MSLSPHDVLTRLIKVREDGGYPPLADPEDLLDRLRHTMLLILSVQADVVDRDAEHAESDIVTALATCDEPVDDRGWCALCLQQTHTDNCPWRRAKEQRA